MAYEIKRFPYDGTIDADGHILEPPDLWETYLENAYKPRAMREDNLRPSKERRYADNFPFGACDVKERLSLLDQENLDATLLYPTIGLLWKSSSPTPRGRPRSSNAPCATAARVRGSTRSTT